MIANIKRIKRGLNGGQIPFHTTHVLNTMFSAFKIVLTVFILPLKFQNSPEPAY